MLNQLLPGNGSATVGCAATFYGVQPPPVLFLRTDLEALHFLPIGSNSARLRK